MAQTIFLWGQRSFNKVTQLGDERATIPEETIASFDAVVNYNIPTSLNFLGLDIEPFLEGGTGYTWFAIKGLTH